MADTFRITTINETTGAITVQFSFKNTPVIYTDLPLSDKQETLDIITFRGKDLKKTVASQVSQELVAIKNVDQNIPEE